MRYKVTSTINTGKILRKRGLGESKGATKALASIVKAYCDPYVPMEQGTLKNTVQTVDAVENVFLVYGQPYAHYQYHGEVMAGRAPKQYTGRPLTYHEEPMRGKEWDKRMMADRGDDVSKALAVYVGGKAK